MNLRNNNFSGISTMKKIENNGEEKSSRRNFLKKVGIGVGAVSLAGVAGTSLLTGKGSKTKSGKTVKLLTTDGKLVEVDKEDIKPAKRLWLRLRTRPEKGFQTENSAW
jgi:hypothetical protein